MKKNLLLAFILGISLAMTGCGEMDDSNINRVEPNVSDNNSNNGKEVDAQKTSEKDVQQQGALNNSENNETVNNEIGNQQANNENTNTTEIAEEQAKSIALEDAQVKESDVKRIRIERDRDDGRQVYDIDFYAGTKEYDYEIDLYTGQILSRDLDIEDDFYEEQNNQSTGLISKEEAIAIVLKKVDGATENDVRIELDEDDGKWKYEGEIHYNQKEYEFELNAQNGKILEWSEESIYD